MGRHQLVIEEKSNQRCSDGKTYARNTVNCEIGPDGAAQCKGSQPGDPRSYKVQIAAEPLHKDDDAVPE